MNIDDNRLLRLLSHQLNVLQLHTTDPYLDADRDLAIKAVEQRLWQSISYFRFIQISSEGVPRYWYGKGEVYFSPYSAHRQ